MKVTADTNVVVRFILRDNEQQARLALNLLKDAGTIAITVSCLCEFVWVLRRVYGFPPNEISIAIKTLLGVRNVTVDRPAVEAGLATLDGGGDFADGLIAYEGRWLGGETFLSFDKKAVALLLKQGQKARLLS